ncbi:ATP-dependent RNA helicase [Mycena pura]|uniref:ATP-dependent RNA helicase n=1 Tax=Mycena pura TaxID=153505 RepID=A0AAD6YDW5_9AGAR|nr:ATP-dependent RNA helicase [Mycena pura]
MTSQRASALAGSKRKLQQNSVARKRVKTSHETADSLPWKAVARPLETGSKGDDGILELEEVDNVQVVYEDTEGGRVATFKVVSTEPELQPGVEDHVAESPADDASDTSEHQELEYFDSVNLLPNWHSYSLHPQLLRSLHSRRFLSPTPIQASTVPFASSGRDVVGIAQTGSGKTLAYGLPILHHLLSCARPRSSKKRELGALILAPTRELALQVSSHLNACLNTVEDSDETQAKNGKEKPTQPRSPPLVSVAAIVGGMSAQKQRRILDRGVDVLVATPGRLWDIMEDDDGLAKQVKKIKFLVLDEADRMIEAGHFAELENILRLTLRESKADQIEPEATEDVEELTSDGLQTFVFSATMSKDLQRNLKRRSRPKAAGKSKKNGSMPASALDDLLLRLDFRDPLPEIIDLSPQGGVVATLKESKIECLSADKDVYLYYFLLRYPGRSLVFLSSIDGIRRLLPLTELLNIKAFPLHSQLEQRQRLKNLDRFKSTPNSVLLATDIAARGLDIPAVDHVIHYQVPRSADAYVHRNGRTARATLRGFSMLMCAPDERRLVRALLGSLGRQESEIAEMDIELDLLDKLKERVQLARQIETTHHKVKKANHDRKWMKETAEALEVDDSDEDKPSNKKRKARDLKNANLKAELKRLLMKPLVARGVSTRYITSGSRTLVDDLIAGEFNETMVGIKKSEAGNDLVVGRRGKKKKTVSS